MSGSGNRGVELRGIRFTKVAAMVIASVVVASLGLAPPAAADPPPVVADRFFLFHRGHGEGDTVYPAGSVCNFTLREQYELQYSLLADPAGPFAVMQQRWEVTHTNQDTGAVLVDHDVVNWVSRPNNPDSFRQVGVFWHLRDANGRSVTVKAGFIEYNYDLDVLKFTRNVETDAAAVICPALGGAPA
jgi:hypothetical protein